MSEELLASVVTAISNVGFPIFLSIYLLNKMETKIDAMITAIQELTVAIRTNQPF
ncbi:YvrJ family protein [Allofustis seminis]|uniref:YvrJ family protein n=1 Tax=Allofustis seminis TaxID=166939 RepID=UPI00036ED144|nr:YvrJ family protein [Allofustis seminis]